jgi:hypothetical protein
MASADLFWTPAPQSADIDAAVRAYEGRWRDALTRPTHSAQSGLRGPLLLAVMIVLFGALAAILPFGKAIDLMAFRDQITVSAALALLCVVAPLAMIELLARATPPRLNTVILRSAVLTGAQAVLAMLGVAMIWSLLQGGVLAIVLAVAFLGALALGCVSVFNAWRPRLAATLAEVPLTTPKVSGAPVLALAVYAVAFVLMRSLAQSTSDDFGGMLVSAIVCAVACYVIAWLVSLGTLNLVRVLIGIGVLR